MNEDIPLGSTVRIPLGANDKIGMLVMRHSRNPRHPQRLAVQMGEEGHPDHHSISFSSSMYQLETLSLPPPGSMLVMSGMESGPERVLRLCSGRLAALDWLDEHLPDWRDHGTIAVVPACSEALRWHSPVPLSLVPSRGSEDFHNMIEGTTGIPIGDHHPGAFGYRRRHHIHEGVDLYVPEGTPVTTVETGRVAAIIPFTGAIASPPTTFWNDTWAVLVEGASGTVVYGEIDDVSVAPGKTLAAGTRIGMVRRVLVKEKSPPRPMSMLHIELHRHGTRDAYEWPVDGPRPESLLDPTEMLLSIILHD